jgi:hypothetical protein
LQPCYHAVTGELVGHRDSQGLFHTVDRPADKEAARFDDTRRSVARVGPTPTVVPKFLGSRPYGVGSTPLAATTFVAAPRWQPGGGSYVPPPVFGDGRGSYVPPLPGSYVPAPSAPVAPLPTLMPRSGSFVPPVASAPYPVPGFPPFVQPHALAYPVPPVACGPPLPPGSFFRQPPMFPAPFSPWHVR